jgi:hypothetical protein
MTPFECACEEDVLAAIGTGRWPDRVDADLRAHVADCAVCRDIVTVAVAFESAPALRTDLPRVPDSGVIWLRAQLRARAEAARAAARPITVVQALSFASIVGLFGVLLGASSAWLQTGVQWLAGMARALDPRALSVPAPVLAALTDHATLIGMVGLVLLLMPLAVYFAMKEPREEPR